MLKKFHKFMCNIGLHSWQYFDNDFAMKQDLGHMQSFWFCKHCDKTV
jgi:hypothetical protein